MTHPTQGRPAGPAAAATPRVGGASIALHLRRMRDWAERTGALDARAAVPPPWPEGDGPVVPRADR